MWRHAMLGRCAVGRANVYPSVCPSVTSRRLNVRWRKQIRTLALGTLVFRCVVCLSVRPSVYPPVRPAQASIVSKRLD